MCSCAIILWSSREPTTSPSPLYTITLLLYHRLYTQTFYPFYHRGRYNSDRAYPMYDYKIYTYCIILRFPSSINCIPSTEHSLGWWRTIALYKIIMLIILLCVYDAMTTSTNHPIRRVLSEHAVGIDK